VIQTPSDSTPSPTFTAVPSGAADLLSWEDEQLVARVHDGDDVAIAVLLTRYRPLIRARARSYFLVGGDRDDLIQEGMVGLFKAVRDYDVTRDLSFRGFAEVCVSRQIISAVKASTRFKHRPLNGYVSINEPADDGGPAFADFIAAPGLQDPADVIVSAERMRALRAHLGSALSRFEAEVLHLHLSGASYAEMALRVGRGTKAIDNALQRVKRKLEAHLEQRERSEVG
jgi:RNA polymerase sporulation-specific sigma factor